MINLSIKLKQNVASCGSRMQKIGGLWMRAIKEPTFHQKMWGLWVTAEKISKNMGSLGDSSAENRRSLEPYIRVTSIMGVPPPPWVWQHQRVDRTELHEGQTQCTKQIRMEENDKEVCRRWSPIVRSDDAPVTPDEVGDGSKVAR